MAEQEQVATRDWHTRARVRVLETTVKHSVDPWVERTFHQGEEIEMIMWGRAGRPIRRDAWWTSYDIDGAFIIEASKVEVIEILDEIAPLSEEETKAQAYNREIDESNRIAYENRPSPWLPRQPDEER